MNNIDSLVAEEHSKAAYYSNGKADLCGDLLEQFADMPDPIRDTLYVIQRTERTRAITEFETTLKLLSKGDK